MRHFAKTMLMFFMLSILAGSVFCREHPTLSISASEAAEIKSALGQHPLLDHSFDKTLQTVEAALAKPMEIPAPGEAGGYAHERHKQNYREMQQAGVLFAITGNEKYARFVRDMLEGYAKMYPTLGPHPLSHKQQPGRLFHQTLNEAVWLVYTAQAYDCIYEWLSEKERLRFEKNIFHKMVQMFSVEHVKTFDKIHNHGTWAVAAVGMIGYVMNQPEWVEMALLGSKKDGKGGFLKQLELLFSPDGYYMEGPYYIRYALRPFFLFAEAIERNQPERKIFEYRDQILKKVYYATLQTTFPNGVFAPINDASKSMDITNPGPLVATDITYYRYGGNANLQAIVHHQNEVMLNGAGLKIASDLAGLNTTPTLNLPSVELRDGHDGQGGGLGILRSGSGADQTMLLMKYGVHGEGHGHFDKLHFILYDQQREVIRDYGFARWINIEPKFGGRYLPENNSYAKQTIAHNTIVVDGKTQHNANRKIADQHHAERHFFDSSNSDAQVMSARANQQYDGVSIQRTLFLLNDKGLDHPMVIDLVRLSSETDHQYDYPIHYLGQLITTNFKYQAATGQMRPLGQDAGYQHIWQTASATSDGLLQIGWLDSNRYYSLSMAAAEGQQIFFGRAGANDPHFNLRSEPMLMVRRTGGDQLFAAVVEPHGFFDEAHEKSVNARSQIASIAVVGHSEVGSVVEVSTKTGLFWRLRVSNGTDSHEVHQLKLKNRSYSWKGNFRIERER